jgi:phosphotransferase system enzyme I (PtsI)
MNDGGAERVLRGVPACGGLALGPVLVPAQIHPSRRAGTPGEEAAALRRALAEAAEGLGRLMAVQDRLAAEILEFQAMLIEDDEITAPAFERIAAGEPAETAWRAVLDAEIADYGGSATEHMAARAADLADLRDRVLRALSGGQPAIDAPEGAILVAKELTPSAFLELDWSRLGGAALGGGSATSHVAILARARGVPMLVGLGRCEGVESGTPAALDAEGGTLTVAPSPATLSAMRARIAAAAEGAARAAEAARRPAVTRTGRRIRVMLNVDDPAMLDGLDPEICDGIGLTRTEFLFHGGALPDEDAQAAVYARILRWAGGRPVTIRTLDAGGDKPIPGVTPEGEANPFLGVRGLRLSLRHPELFRLQLRALARAAALGPLKVMLPMVTVPGELAAAAAHLDAAIAGLAAEGVRHARPALGIMIETPAAALTAAGFPADFYSIGSNDLIQYVTAAARDNPALAPLADPLNPAVLELIRRTVEAGRARRVEVSLCGDMASTPGLVPTLIGLGLEALSVAPAQLGPVKLAIAECG